MEGYDSYVSPFCQRYAGKAMQQVFSADFKFGTWRKLWIALAEAEQQLGLDISDEQITQMRAHAADIDYARAEELEHSVRHDVMAHLLAYGEQCPTAKPIMHLGATSCYVGDNTDVIQMRQAMLLVKGKLLHVLAVLRDFAERYKSLGCLGYTHFQAAQPTTVGKRATLWMQDLVTDLNNLDFQLNNLALLGCKGTTGTAASFLQLFDGDVSKVKQLDKLIAEKTGFSRTVSVSGQTYSRKTDYNVLSVLCGIAQSAHKFANDVRLLSHEKELEEPFESAQIGSSAMAYKRNPMRSERMTALCRYVICDSLNPALTASEQWLERTLDDSANRRVSLPEAFLAVDGILTLYANIASGLTVYPKVIEKNLARELPFMATESILMYCVEHKGGDRQALHEAIRQHSFACARAIKEDGADNDLLARIVADERFGLTADEVNNLVDVQKFTGMAAEQVQDFIADVDEIFVRNKKFVTNNDDGVTV